MTKRPSDCQGCFHNAGMGVCLADEHACKANNYSSYRFRDFTHLAEYVTRYDIRCFNATRDDETGGVRLEVH